MKCKCGCGQETSGKIDHGKLPEYVRGHVQRGRKYPYKPRPKAVGRLVWNKGIKGKFPNQNIQGLKLGQKRGAESLHWKGNDVGYFALHNWIARELGKPDKCEICGISIPKRYVWANKSGQYRRDFNDWIRLCPKCHAAYDNIWVKGQITRKANRWLRFFTTVYILSLSTMR